MELVTAPPIPHPELAAEQAYIDRAYELLDRMRALLEHAPDAAEGEIAALALERWAKERLRTYVDAERGLCFGRMDVEGAKAPLYVGRRWVHDEDQDVVVVNWQAPAARPFYTATPVDPQRVSLRRRFRLERRRLLEILDEALGGGAGDDPGPLADVLLDELQRSREPRMRDIVATIQSDQYGLITRDLDGLLVIQGGPGTGKTAVALHRASWLLYTFRERLAADGVLVVGPNPAFMEYVSHVLPALGEDAVEQRAVGELVAEIEPATTDAPEVERLKGDARLAEVVARAIDLRIRPESDDLWARIGGAGVTVLGTAVTALVEEARREALSYAAGRERFRMNLLRRFYDGYGRRLGGAAMLSFDDVERTLRRDGLLKRVLDRHWPPLDAEGLVRGLLTSRARLAEAADGILEPAEQRLLLRRRAGFAWSEADLALVDEARHRLAGAPKSFGHVVVDEAQDLTPMQLRMVARRARRSSLTVLGDIAQATGPYGYFSWDEVLPHLPADAGVSVEELRLAYRVPREIMDLATPLLPLVAAEATAPIAYRSGGEAPRIVDANAESLVEQAVAEAARLRAGEGTVGLIVPSLLLEAAHGALGRAGLRAEDSVAEELAPAVRLLAPRMAKGLEFDHVVVVEPTAIVEERGGIHGLRELYVSLTRPTKTLVVVHSRPLPEPLVTQRGRA
jgi:DNA helicase IV